MVNTGKDSFRGYLWIYADHSVKSGFNIVLSISLVFPTRTASAINAGPSMVSSGSSVSEWQMET